MSEVVVFSGQVGVFYAGWLDRDPMAPLFSPAAPLIRDPYPGVATVTVVAGEAVVGVKHVTAAVQELDFVTPISPAWGMSTLHGGFTKKGSNESVVLYTLVVPPLSTLVGTLSPAQVAFYNPWG